ncbi:MAG: DUF2243 domain-containing protein [Terrimicrobiaceae bacterium]|nr:DUF2243 domain-containing protein [Terrimicrobiaceae bacterium]
MDFRAPAGPTGPLIRAGTFLGLGLGGFVDGILLHQVLQWHQMISNILPPDTLNAAKVNMFWDGIFHAGTWMLTATGVAGLWMVACRSDVPRSTMILWGSLLFGWGLFNLMDSVFDHYLFGLHNVRENVPDVWAWNLGFLLLAASQTVAGWMIISAGRRRLRSSYR